MSSNLHPAFSHRQYLFRRKFFKLFGAAFHVYDPAGNVVFYSKQKAFKLKEDFRVYSREDQQEELLAITTPHIIDLGATYYVKDSTTGEDVGALKRKAWKSFVKDEWLLMDTEGVTIAKLQEESVFSALLSRFINLVPQTYHINTKDGRIATIKQHFNPFILKYTWTIAPDSPIDPRLLIAAGVLLAGIEGRQR